MNEQYAPNNSQRVMLWLVKYLVNLGASPLDIGMFWGRLCIVQTSPSNLVQCTIHNAWIEARLEALSTLGILFEHHQLSQVPKVCHVL